MSEMLPPLDGQILAAFDVETTGLSALYGDRICEVGLVRAQGDEILATYQTLVNPGALDLARRSPSQRLER